MKITREEFGIYLLRFGLASVFLYFGFSQLFNSLNFVSIVPDWASNFLHLPPAMIVLGNGTLEVVLGSMLAIGFFVRIVSFVLAIHLLFIAFSFGLSETGVRDLGITIATFALFFIYKKNAIQN